jgi:hypothetical protein
LSDRSNKTAVKKLAADEEVTIYRLPPKSPGMHISMGILLMLRGLLGNARSIHPKPYRFGDMKKYNASPPLA